MGKADYYADGDWNFYCDLCGAKTKASDGVRTWDNFYVCRHHNEVRNPQDFVKGVRDNQTPPWIRSQPPDIFLGFFGYLVEGFGDILQEDLGLILLESGDFNLVAENPFWSTTEEQLMLQENFFFLVQFPV